jgi:hypothetical protein
MTQPQFDVSHSNKPDSNTPKPADVENPNLSSEHQLEGDADRPSDSLDRGQPPSTETVPRKSSLT